MIDIVLYVFLDLSFCAGHKHTHTHPLLLIAYSWSIQSCPLVTYELNKIKTNICLIAVHRSDFKVSAIWPKYSNNMTNSNFPIKKYILINNPQIERNVFNIYGDYLRVKKIWTSTQRNNINNKILEIYLKVEYSFNTCLILFLIWMAVIIVIWVKWFHINTTNFCFSSHICKKLITAAI